jgi:cleavage stimulation factor subunit 3
MATGYTAETPVSAWAQDGGYDAGVDQNGSSYQVSHDHQEQDAPASYSLGDNAADDGSYDPASLAPPQVASQMIAKPSPKPPKSAGGFLVEESDDEDDTSTPVANAPKARGVSVRGASSTAQASQPAQAAGGVPSIVSPASQVNTVVPTATETVPTGTSISTLSAARARLSNDPVKILEDNISEDPRGAMDSWLALMAEHRRRNKTTEARKVYERFLKIFPTSVSYLLDLNQQETTGAMAIDTL